MVLSNQVAEVVLTHRDRLLRFGSELIFRICEHFGVKVTVLDESPPSTDEEELTRDVIMLMVVFSARLYGKRSHRNRKKIAA